MTPIRRFGAVDIVLFVYVVLIAAGFRAGYLMLSADNGKNTGPLVVQDADPDLQVLAHSVRDGSSFSSYLAPLGGGEDTAHASPGYPWLLGLLGRLAPDDAQRDFYVRWGQCALGALTAGFYFLFARRAFRSLAVGIVAGTLCALHPFWVVNTAQINDGVLVSFLVALSLFTGARASQMGGPFASLLFGLGLACTALVRAALLPFAFVGLAWFLLRTRRLPSGWLAALLSFLGFVIGVAPWTVRNLQLFGEPIPVVDSAYVHLWIGNNAYADGGPLPSEVGLPPDLVAKLKADPKQPERYAQLGPVVWEEMRRNPPAVATHRVQAGLAFFFGVPLGVPPNRLMGVNEAAQTDSQIAEAVKALLSYEVLFFWALLGMLVLGLLGWRWSFGWAAESTPAALAMIWIPLPYILSHAEVLSGPRLPLDGVLLCYSAFALMCFVPGLRRHLLGGAKAAVGPQPH